jgi:hypothetical protein
MLAVLASASRPGSAGEYKFNRLLYGNALRAALLRSGYSSASVAQVNSLGRHGGKTLCSWTAFAGFGHL